MKVSVHQTIKLKRKLEESLRYLNILNLTCTGCCIQDCTGFLTKLQNLNLKLEPRSSDLGGVMYPYCGGSTVRAYSILLDRRGTLDRGQEIQNANHMVSARGYVAVLVFPIFTRLSTCVPTRRQVLRVFPPPPRPSGQNESVTTETARALFVKSRRGHSRVWFGSDFRFFSMATAGTAWGGARGAPARHGTRARTGGRL